MDAAVLQYADNFCRFICGNAATDSESDLHDCRRESRPQAEIQLSCPMALSSISLGTSTAATGASGMTHFTLPALISSCAILQGLRECVSITGGAPPWSWRARRAATRMYR